MFYSILHNLRIDSQIEKETSVQFQNENDLLMYYHTTLRNIGLFTSIAFAALSTARVGQYNSKNNSFFVGIFRNFINFYIGNIRLRYDVNTYFFAAISYIDIFKTTSH